MADETAKIKALQMEAMKRQLAIDSEMMGRTSNQAISKSSATAVLGSNSEEVLYAIIPNPLEYAPCTTSMLVLQVITSVARFAQAKSVCCHRGLKTWMPVRW